MDNHPLPFNVNANRSRAQIIRSGISATVKNLSANEEYGSTEFAAGRLTAARVTAQNQAHRNLVQHLSQLANRHAHLCHIFDSSQLVFDNIDVTEDPTCRRAISRCTSAIEELNIVDPNVVHPNSINCHVHSAIALWFSPAFNCTQHDFHHAVWELFVSYHPPIIPEVTQDRYDDDAEEDDAIFFDIESGDDATFATFATAQW